MATGEGGGESDRQPLQHLRCTSLADRERELLGVFIGGYCSTFVFVLERDRLAVPDSDLTTKAVGKSLLLPVHRPLERGQLCHERRRRKPSLADIDAHL